MNQNIIRSISRRRLLKSMTGGLAATYAWGALPVFARSSLRRQVVVMSDLHIGRTEDGRDGEEWLARALADIKENLGPISYGLTLGDISQNGDSKSILKYIRLRDASSIPRWFELAGNHEYYSNGIGHYTSLIRGTDPYLFMDGNIVYFFISDQVSSRQGDMTDKAWRWLKENIEQYRDKIIIVCSHQLPANTIRRSREDVFCLHPKEKVEDLLATGLVDLWLCGHEHHSPYSKGCFVRLGNTTVINVASMSHAYGTTRSESTLLEFEENARHILARRRVHDTKSFSDEFMIEIPVRNPVCLSEKAGRPDAVVTMVRPAVAPEHRQRLPPCEDPAIAR